ncbi:hypothetical protein SAMN05216588_102409 [Pseudomonas flavescens]|uniref:Uncharacterized protein n=1 Tax=Phytopseudomonas flavescens TaxID=29435 RepID=A0A1G7ZN71_9GAMM|nr:hypothetical protein SAMN05216588_102409 [Pseudomonas flavescens]
MADSRSEGDLQVEQGGDAFHDAQAQSNAFDIAVSRFAYAIELFK